MVISLFLLVAKSYNVWYYISYKNKGGIIIMDKKVTIKSRRFENLEIEVYESKNDMGRTIYLIRHSELLDIIENRLPENIKIEYDWDSIQVLEPHHYVVKAWIKDSNGICVKMFGESLPATLNTTISKQYPATIAANRAIDRAIIKYLDIPRTYSSEEIAIDTKEDTKLTETNNSSSESGEKTNTATKNEQLPVMKNVNSEAEFAEENEETANEEAVNETKQLSLAEKRDSKLKQNLRKTTSAEEPKGNDVSSENKADKNQTPSVSNESETKPHKTVGNSTIITFGRCKDMTLDETFEKDLATLKWIAENIYDGQHAKLGNTVRKYLEFKKVSYNAKKIS